MVWKLKKVICFRITIIIFKIIEREGMKIIVISDKDNIEGKINEISNFLKHEVFYYENIDDLIQKELFRTAILLIDTLVFTKEQINKLLSFKQINSNLRVVYLSDSESKSILDPEIRIAIDHYEFNCSIETFLKRFVKLSNTI